jgi:flagellin-specific chaperone FliS
MMDSQDNTLNKGIEEEKQQEEAVSNAPSSVTTPENEPEQQTAEAHEADDNDAVKAQTTAETQADGPEEDLSKKVYNSKKEVIERLKEIVSSDETPVKAEIDHLKTTFYKLHFAEREKQQKEYLEAGGDPEKYQIVPDEDEEVFKAEMGVIKEKRQKALAEIEEEKQENLKRKEDIIEKIKAMSVSPEEANKSYNDFKALQQEWKNIKAVPADKSNELWHNYQLHVEQFYDMLNLNREAREYDFKKNLEAKTKLCEAAEKLADEPDVISAFHQLQDLHQQYREIGPVAKDLREQIWARFKAASTVINKKHQQHFDELRAKEEDNLRRKTELCERVEAVAKEENKGTADWDKHTQQIIDIQKEWKTIGFAPQKMNVKIFERFRAACDDFFTRKGEFFKKMKAQFAENAEKKKALVEKAQALMDSTDWRSTSDKLIALQKEWKTIGMVPHKLGDKLWADFQQACNHFFDARNAANAGTRNAEHENLEKKKDIIEKLKALLSEAGDDVQQKVQALTEEFNKVGHVPYKEKDKVYEEYHAVLDRIYKELHVNAARRRMDNFRNNLKNVAERGANALDNERGRLMRQYDRLKNDITTYENNLGFLNVSSKKGNSLIEEMNRRIQKLKDELEETRQKIKEIDAQNK